MSKRENQQGVMIYIPKDLHKRFKISLAESEQKQKDVVQRMIESFCDENDHHRTNGNQNAA